MRFQPFRDVDDEVERDYGKRKSFLGTADFEYEDCALARVKAYIEGFAKFVKEKYESRAAVHESSDSQISMMLLSTTREVDVAKKFSIQALNSPGTIPPRQPLLISQ